MTQMVEDAAPHDLVVAYRLAGSVSELDQRQRLQRLCAKALVNSCGGDKMDSGQAIV